MFAIKTEYANIPKAIHRWSDLESKKYFQSFHEVPPFIATKPPPAKSIAGKKTIEAPVKPKFRFPSCSVVIVLPNA